MCRFPLLQVLLFAQSIKTPHICRLGAQGKHGKVVKYINLSYFETCLACCIYLFLCMYLQKHGLKVYMRDPHAFTPMLEEGVRGAPPRSLTLGSDMAMNQREIGKFSQKDAKVI